jgi:hypothetical protein
MTGDLTLHSLASGEGAAAGETPTSGPRYEYDSMEIISFVFSVDLRLYEMLLTGVPLAAL